MVGELADAAGLYPRRRDFEFDYRHEPPSRTTLRGVMASPLTVISGVTTVFQNVDAYAGDPIPSLMEAFQQDPRADKVNLSIGLYL